MNDRELLELAAEAAGAKPTKAPDGKVLYYTIGCSGWPPIIFRAVRKPL